MKDMALDHVDDPVTAGLIKSDQYRSAYFQTAKGSAAAGIGRRKVGRTDFRFQPMLPQRAGHARRAIVCVGLIGQMLKLASTAFGKMPARRRLAAQAGLDRSVVEQDVARNCERDMASASRDPVPACRDPDNGLAHKSASATGMAFTRSSAIIRGPAASAARP